MTELKLHLKQGDTEQTVTVHQDVFTIGRLPKCDLYLPFGGVSRCHARIVRVTANVWTIEDLGSKNGTKLNNIPIYSPQQLCNRDILWVGEVNLQVMLV